MIQAILFDILASRIVSNEYRDQPQIFSLSLISRDRAHVSKIVHSTRRNANADRVGDCIRYCTLPSRCHRRCSRTKGEASGEKGGKDALECSYSFRGWSPSLGLLAPPEPLILSMAYVSARHV